jgi:hypothetical protein
MQQSNRQTTTDHNLTGVQFTTADLQSMSEATLLKFTLAYLAFLFPSVNEVNQLSRITGISISAINQYKRGGVNCGSMGAQAWKKVYNATMFSLIHDWHRVNSIE